MKGISLREVTGETARNMIYIYIWDSEIMNDDSWMKTHFPKTWGHFHRAEIKSREKKTAEVIES